VDEITRLRTPALADCTDSQFPFLVSSTLVSGFGLRFRRSQRSLIFLYLAISLRLETRDWNRKLGTEN
jgi:hypothetical protein